MLVLVGSVENEVDHLALKESFFSFLYRRAIIILAYHIGYGTYCVCRVNKALHGHVSTGASTGQAAVVTDEVSSGKGSTAGNAGHELMYLQVRSYGDERCRCVH